MKVLKHKFLLVYCHIIMCVTYVIPDFPLSMRIRGWLYSLFMGACGKNFQVAHGVCLRGIELIEVGNNCYIGPRTFLMARERICIDDEAIIAMNVVIVDSNHGKFNGSYRYARGKTKSIHIGRGSWIAANSVITAGSIVEDGCIIPPCTVVREIK
ncbi:acyltransferase [Vibrio cholerae]|uniref:acyltransferase n=2 Tax=Vibrio cholerae TaxID=666 RepID=UPI001157C6FC|nr:acyltransferase [Vibrio cholerae]EGR2041118.1 acyltransferase [Vibrio cholerae]EGR2064762.1 acyltransferase [Vibrio cholerae]EGR2116130.1 acyltransferase [Vibrio cholerae]EGR2244796.1 acyltransferase [Vibrio cholerae]TQO71596.1 acyltransferase [Vibrio cholerae]